MRAAGFEKLQSSHRPAARQCVRRHRSVVLASKDPELNNQVKAAQPVDAQSDPDVVTVTRVSRRGVLGALAATGLAPALCPCCSGVAHAKPYEWGYGDVSGPQRWSGMCAIGKGQSPVDLPVALFNRNKSMDSPWGTISTDYKTLEYTSVLNTGHGTMQVNLQDGNYAFIGTRKLQLLQFHFHTPSEHAFDGKRYPMEAHLVHKDVETGKLGVLGIMLDRGGKKMNPCLRNALDYAPAKPKATAPCPKKLNPAALLPPTTSNGNRPYIHYVGSLTTPPCSEEVQWFVFTQPLQVSDDEILDFQEFVGGKMTYATNSRPLQGLNQRLLDFVDV